MRMKISLKPENLRERIALAFDLIPRPLGDVVLGPLLAKAVLAASSLDVFDALMDRPRTVEEVGAHCGSAVKASGKLLRRLYADRSQQGLYVFIGNTRSQQVCLAP